MNYFFKFFKSNESVFAGGISILICLVCWILPANTLIAFWHLVSISSFLLLIIWYLLIQQYNTKIDYDKKNDDYEKKFNEQLKKLIFKTQIVNFEKDRRMILFKTNINNIILTNMLITMYEVRNGYETRIGILKIHHIQENDIIQADIISLNNNINISSLHKENIVIKLGISNESLNELLNNRRYSQ